MSLLVNLKYFGNLLFYIKLLCKFKWNHTRPTHNNKGSG